MRKYLLATRYIDCDHPSVLACARELASDVVSDQVVARRCFEFVRDQVAHSWDHRRGPVTCSASDTLTHMTGYCYAKSHLLAALLRANGIPAALGYQRLSVGDGGPPYCLHGLNVVWLSDHGWYRIDARGNRPGVSALFDPPAERLAFAADDEGEFDVPGLWAEPLPAVIDVLTMYRTIDQVHENLPDWRRGGSSQQADQAGSPTLGG